MVSLICRGLETYTHDIERMPIDVTSTLTTLIVEGISSHSMLLDQYVVLHAAFVASLHKVVGVEFGMSI